MEHPHSSPVDWVGQEHLGFVINAAFSAENASLISQWLEGLNQRVPQGIYTMPLQSLHITVLDWVAPLFDYGGADKRALYAQLYKTYEPVLRTTTDSMGTFDIQFSELKVTPGAIILVGQDDGQFAHLRDTFMNAVEMPEGGKQPPTIIHSSLARFIAPQIKLSQVEDYVIEHPLDFIQTISEFRLIETRREPMQDFSVIDNFKLTR